MGRIQLSGAVLSMGLVSLMETSIANAGQFSGRYKITCVESPQGCECKDPNSPGASQKVFHAEPVEGILKTDQSQKGSALVAVKRIKFGGGTCLYPAQRLRPILWDNTTCADPNSFKKLPFTPLSQLLKQGSTSGKQIAAGGYFPTFYNVAFEGFYSTTDKSESLYEEGTGKLISKISKNYRVDLDIQGTGELRDGRVINVAKRKNGVWSYKVMPKGSFGEGIFEHQLIPFRTIAIDMVQLCKESKMNFCDLDVAEVRRRMVGSLVYIPKLKGVKLPGGQTHDGYMCAQDIGGDIKGERLDLFVGPMGAGNPYLPDCRTTNSFIKAGVQSIVPYDWRTYVADGVGDDGLPKFKRKFPEEHKTVSASKKLPLWLVSGAKCKEQF